MTRSVAGMLCVAIEAVTWLGCLYNCCMRPLRALRQEYRELKARGFIMANGTCVYYSKLQGRT